MSFLDKVKESIGASSKVAANESSSFLANLQRSAKSADAADDEEDDDDETPAAASEEEDTDEEDEGTSEEDGIDEEDEEDEEDQEAASGSKASAVEKRYQTVLTSPHAKGGRYDLAMSLLGNKEMSTKAILSALKAAPKSSGKAAKAAKSKPVLAGKMASEKQPDVPPSKKRSSGKATVSLEDEAAARIISLDEKTRKP